MVAVAAYRAGEALKDDRRGTVADYSRRRGVVHAEIVVPEGCAEWLGDRETLWNHVEAIEQRRDAQLAREINIALPHELTKEERLDLVRAFVREQFVAEGMVVDFAIHAPVPEKGDDPRNFHAHVLLSMRQATPLGLRRVKTREWNSDSMLIKWREAWASHQNKALRERGLIARVDHRTLAVQKASALSHGDRVHALTLERVPEVHVGPKVRKAVRQRPPASKDKVKGPVRRRPTGRKTRRVVRYTEFDEGSRSEFNTARLRANAGRFAMKAAKIQAHLAKFKTRQAHYVARIRESELVEQAREDRATAWERTLHARKRAAQIQWLISELDRLFFELLHLRENQLVRLTVWSNRFGYWRQDLPYLHVWGRARPR
ncbi:MobA/MobL family protein [Bradyrhizobium sp. CSA207]|nr:MobA/MobL family protein [Bradyrhizobium sp. CSA207]